MSDRIEQATGSVSSGGIGEWTACTGSPFRRNEELAASYRKGMEDAAKIVDEWSEYEEPVTCCKREQIRIVDRIRSLTPPKPEEPKKGETE